MRMVAVSFQTNQGYALVLPQYRIITIQYDSISHRILLIRTNFYWSSVLISSDQRTALHCIVFIVIALHHIASNQFCIALNRARQATRIGASPQ